MRWRIIVDEYSPSQALYASLSKLEATAMNYYSSFIEKETEACKVTVAY